MQRKSRGVLLALVAVFAMSAVTAAAASATTPEFKPVPAKKKFTATGGEARLEDKGLQYEITCTNSSASGEVTGARTVGGVVLVLTGCTGRGELGSGCPITTVGAKAGEIVTGALGGELGTVAKTQASSGVGLRFKRPEGKKTIFTIEESRCVGEEAAFSGSIAAEVSVVGKKQTTNKLAFALNSSSGQAIEEITLDSGELEKPAFEDFASRVTLKNTDELTFEEALEVT
jgi:hypothetical protein